MAVRFNALEFQRDMARLGYVGLVLDYVTEWSALRVRWRDVEILFESELAPFCVLSIDPTSVETLKLASSIEACVGLQLEPQHGARRKWLDRKRRGDVPKL